MRVVQAQAFGGPEVLVVAEVAEPVAGPGQVVVAVEAADVMYLDTRLRSGWGREFFAVTPPYVPGGAVAGTVIAVGSDVDEAWIGRRVAAPTAASGIGGGVPTGGYAERALAKVETLMPVPDGLTLEQAAALVHDGRTAFAIADAAAIQAGETVLITAAGGGLGILLTQVATAAGAIVIAAARGAEKLALARKLGAAATVDYSEPGWVESARALSDGGVDVVLDGAGGDLGGAALEVLVDGGRFIGYGSADGGFATLDAERATARNIATPNLFDITKGVTDWDAITARAFAAVVAGDVEPVIGQTFPLTQAADAHAAIAARTAIGRTLLLM